MDILVLFGGIAALLIVWLLWAGKTAAVRRRPAARAGVRPAAAAPPLVSPEGTQACATTTTLASTSTSLAYDDLLTGTATGLHDAAATAAAARGAEEAPATLAFTLLDAEDLEPRQREALRGRVSAIELPPRLVQELLAPDFMAEASPRALTELVTCEPVLAGKILGRVNSPFYGVRSPIVGVPHAITFLGVHAVRNMALQFAMEESLASSDPALRRLHAQLFEAGAISASLVEVLAPKVGVRDVGAASTHTALSFLGDFAMSRLLPQQAAASHWPLGLAERTSNEQFTLGANAMIVGQMLMERWQLPASVCDEVGDIHRVIVTPAGSTPSPREVRLALCYLCARLAESIVLGRVATPAQIDLEDDCVVEYFHLQGYLARSPLGRLPEHFLGSEFKRVLSRLAGRSASSERTSASA